MKKLLDTFLPPFSEARREKPKEMLYIAQEIPPPSTVLVAAFQHALVAMMMVIYLVITGTDVGLAGGSLRGFICMGILVMGIGTILNGLTTRVSAGHLLVFIPGTMTMMVFIPVANTFGLGAAMGGLILSGLVVFWMGRFLPRMRSLFPPEVMGVLLLLLGMSLLPGGVQRSTGLTTGGASPLDLSHVLIAAVTLCAVTATAVWGAARLRVLGLIIGAAAGLLAASLTGGFGAKELADVAGQPFFSFPIEGHTLPTPVWVAGAILPLVFVSVIGAVDEMGCGVVADRMNNDQWRRADLPMIGRLLNTSGICIFLGGLAGTLMAGSSSANLGLAHATGISARRVGVVAGILLILVAFLPQFAQLIMLLPAAVIGAMMIYTAAYMMVSGMELILSRLLNGRRRATVGFSVAAGAAVMLIPELAASVPVEWKTILGSGLIVGVSLAIILNQVFRIGISQSREIQLDEPNPAEQAARFLEDCGAAWGARRDVINRAGLAIGEALEVLAGAGWILGPARLSAVFDEYHLDLALDYSGKAWRPAESRPIDWNALVEPDSDDQTIDEAINSVSSGMIRGLADRVESEEQNGQALLTFRFEH